MVGDTATITFTTDEDVEDVAATIDGQTASITMGIDAQHRTASYTFV